MRSLILSQCRDLRIGVTREDLGVVANLSIFQQSIKIAAGSGIGVARNQPREARERCRITHLFHGRLSQEATEPGQCFVFYFYFIYKLCTQCHTIIAETVQNSNRHWRRPTQVLKHLRVASLYFVLFAFSELYLICVLCVNFNLSSVLYFPL